MFIVGICLMSLCILYFDVFFLEFLECFCGLVFWWEVLFYDIEDFNLWWILLISGFVEICGNYKWGNSCFNIVIINDCKWIVSGSLFMFRCVKLFNVNE